MEKLMYLVWLEPDRTRDEVAELLLGTGAQRAAGARAHGPEHGRVGPGERHPGARAHPRGRDAAARARLGLARCRRRTAALTRRCWAGWPPGWPGTRWSSRSTATTAATSGRAARTWPDGERSPGVLTVALIQQHPDLTYEEWITRWHTRISPITEQIQPRCRYVRNAVFRPLTEGAPPVAAIVEEAWPSLEHVTDPMLFYCADGDAETMNAHVTQMIEEINAFTDLSTLRSVTMSEWILKS